MKRNGLFALCLAALMTMMGCVSTNEIHTSGVSAERIEEFRRAINKDNTTKIVKLIKNSSPEENVEGLLLAAKSKKDVEIVNIFLNAGIDVNSVGSDGQTPLMAACEYPRRKELVSLLLEKGADVNSVNSNGDTPLLIACDYYDGCTLAQLLLEKGANVNSVNNNGDTPLILACSYRYDTVQLLLEHGANVNSANSDGTTPLHNACSWWRLESIVRLLLENGANINSADNAGQTALYHAMRESTGSIPLNFDKLSVVRLLIQFGANVNAPQYNGLSPLYIASRRLEKGGTELAELLRDAGAEFNSTDRQSSTNFDDEVIYRKGIPLEIGDRFTIKNGYRVVDRVTGISGYTYLMTYSNNYCFYILSQHEIALNNSYSYTTRTRYITSANDLKLTCTGIGKYQRNYQDVDCYIFTLDEEL